MQRKLALNQNTENKIRAEMLNDLESRGLVGVVYKDKVNEYLALWRTAAKLQIDIEQRGVADNKSVTMLVSVSKQMLAIFNALGFKEICTRAKIEDADFDEL